MGLFDGSDPIASWWLSIALLMVTTVVVGFLLLQVIKTAAAIKDGVAEIWVRGQRVANNTIHIANLYKTNDAVVAILGRAKRIASHSTAIKDHAETCPGCPSCIWQRS